MPASNVTFGHAEQRIGPTAGPDFRPDAYLEYNLLKTAGRSPQAR